MRSRAAFKHTHDHVRKHMFGCTRDADLADGGLARPRKQRPKHNSQGPMVAFLNRTKKYLRRARIWRKILQRWRHAQARDASTPDS